MTDSALRELSASAARRIIGVLVLVSPLEQVAFDIYTPALPKIADHFAATNTLVQNTVTAYVLGMALVVLPAGLIADAIGRKRVLLTGLGLMTLTSIGCALAGNLTMMMGFRFLQGFGAGTCLLLAATVAADCFRGANLSRSWVCSARRGDRLLWWPRPSAASYRSSARGGWCSRCWRR